MAADPAATAAELASWTARAWREGPSNGNPFGPEQGAGDHASYCCSAACMIPYHHGYRWPAGSQFGARGDAYCPFHITNAAPGEWAAGATVDLRALDQVLFSWGRNGVADHIETVKAVYADGTFDTWGFNTGRPEGAWVVRRDRKYLMGRIRPSGYATAAPSVQVVIPEEGPVAMIVIDTKVPADAAGRLPHWQFDDEGRAFNWNGARPLLGLDHYVESHPPIVAITPDPGGDGVVLYGNDTHQEPSGEWARSTYKITVGLPPTPGLPKP